MRPADRPGDPLAAPARRSRAVWWLALLLGAYLLAIRTHDISTRFWLLGDQIRDWRVALRPFNELPLTGVPTQTGGTTLGPIFYWVLWLIRVTVGPFVDNLPHAGGIGLSILHSTADALLFFAHARRLGSVVLSLAIVLLAATAPGDLALTATMWNPVLATTLSKVTMAAALLSTRWSLGGAAFLAALGWLAVQAHMSGIYVALAAMVWVVAQPVLEGRSREALAAVLVVGAVVAVLQLPYAWSRWSDTGPPPRDRIRESLVYTLRHPGGLRLVESARAMDRALNALVWAPYCLPRFGWVLAVGAVLGALFFRREPQVVAMAAVPLLVGIAAFAVWRGRLGQHYWYLPLIPGAVLSLGMFAARIPHVRLRAVLSAVALGAVVLLQPARCAAAWRIHRLPEYEVLVRASRQIARRAPEVRAIEARFLPRTSDPTFLYQILGGRLSRGAPVEAVIDRSGTVTFRRVPGARPSAQP